MLQSPPNGRGDRRRGLALLAAVALGLVAGEALAHHGFGPYDYVHRIKMTGTVIDWRWTNPHVGLTIRASQAGGPPQIWTLEGLSPAMLASRGWSKASFKPGDRIIVQAAPHNQGGRRGALTAMAYADGRKPPAKVAKP